MSAETSSRTASVALAGAKSRFDRPQHVVGLLLQQVDVPVARDAERGVVDDVEAAEQLRQPAGDQVFEQDEILFVVRLDGDEPRQAPAAPAPRRTVCCGPMPRDALEHRRQVQPAIVKARAGMAGVDRHRRENREDAPGGRTCRATCVRGGRDRPRDGCGCRPALRAGTIDSFQQPYCWATSCSVRWAIRCNCVIGARPSAGGSCGSTSPKACSRRPATRTMKNSSRFELKIARNFTRSSSGLFASSASSSTRALNSSQLSSRLMKCSGRKVSGRAVIHFILARREPRAGTFEPA